MPIKVIINPLIFLASGALFTWSFGINPMDHIEIILLLGALFLSTALFANVQELDHTFLEKYKSKSIILVSVGLLFKAFALGLILYLITYDLRFVLIAALMSQIDPSFTNWTHRILGIKGRVAKLTLVESTFDDPISTLLTLYIALPVALGGQINFDFYFFMLFVNFLFVLIFFYAKRRSKVDHSFLSPSAIVLGGIFNIFLGVALSGLIFRVKKHIFDEPINLISYASYFLIGLFIPGIHIELWSGILVGLLLVFVVRPAEVLLFFQGYSIKEKLTLAFAEQKGITTLLLLLIVQPQINILGIVLPAMLTINSLFFITNGGLKAFSKPNNS